MKPTLLNLEQKSELPWSPTAKQIADREDLLKTLDFKHLTGEHYWKYKKAFVTEELVFKAHDSTFVQILQIALMQNFVDPIRKYVVNSEELNDIIPESGAK